jgi:hypothetical protein
VGLPIPNPWGSAQLVLLETILQFMALRLTSSHESTTSDSLRDHILA